jgi:hypothetical protein
VNSTDPAVVRNAIALVESIDTYAGGVMAGIAGDAQLSFYNSLATARGTTITDAGIVEAQRLANRSPEQVRVEKRSYAEARGSKPSSDLDASDMSDLQDFIDDDDVEVPPTTLGLYQRQLEHFYALNGGDLPAAKVSAYQRTLTLAHPTSINGTPTLMMYAPEWKAGSQTPYPADRVAAQWLADQKTNIRNYNPETKYVLGPTPAVTRDGARRFTVTNEDGSAVYDNDGDVAIWAPDYQALDELAVQDMLTEQAKANETAREYAANFDRVSKMLDEGREYGDRAMSGWRAASADYDGDLAMAADVEKRRQEIRDRMNPPIKMERSPGVPVSVY